MNNVGLSAREHRLFWLLANKGRRRDDVCRVYLVIQAAIAFGRDAVDVGRLSGAIMPGGLTAPGADRGGIGASGLAHLDSLFEIDLLAAGEDDRHEYRFRRREDGAQITALLRTAPAPGSLQFAQQYAREHRRLEAERTRLLAVARW